MSMPVGIGRVKLSDGTIIKLKTLIVDVKEAGFSPFGGVNFDVKVIGGVATESVPDDVKELVKDKPLASPEPPKGLGDLGHNRTTTCRGRGEHVHLTRHFLYQGGVRSRNGFVQHNV